MDNPQKGSARIPVSSAFLFHPVAPIYLDEHAKSEHSGTLRLHVPVRALLCCLFSRLIRGEVGRRARPAVRIPPREHFRGSSLSCRFFSGSLCLHPSSSSSSSSISDRRRKAQSRVPRGRVPPCRSRRSRGRGRVRGRGRLRILPRALCEAGLS